MKHERSVLKGDPRDTTEWSGYHRGSADGSMKEEAVFSGLEKYEEYARLGRWIIGIVAICTAYVISPYIELGYIQQR